MNNPKTLLPGDEVLEAIHYVLSVVGFPKDTKEPQDAEAKVRQEVVEEIKKLLAAQLQWRGEKMVQVGSTQPSDQGPKKLSDLLPSTPNVGIPWREYYDWAGKQDRDGQGCLHDACEGCKNGTCGGMHMISCPCKKCSPWN